RYEIVTGAVEVDGAPEKVKIEQGENKAAEEKGVPDFWLIALKNNEITAEEVRYPEFRILFYEEVLSSIIKISSGTEFKNQKEPLVPYFKNTVLTKTYHMIDEDEPILKKAIGTEIERYPGNCLTRSILKKRSQRRDPKTQSLSRLMDNEKFRSKRQAKNKEVREG
ncbi:hypothetical protein HID58_092069, partial [Brassica napus]